VAFHLTVAGSLEPLAAHLAAVLAEPLDDPFTPELVAVPGGGVQAWLTARLARQLGATGPGALDGPGGAVGDGPGGVVGDGPGGVVGDGIVANVEFVFPASIVARAVGEGSGIGRWSTGPLTWAVHEVLQELGPELGQATDAVRARAVADLFDRYTLYRPQMVRGWSDGRDVDGVGAPLEPHQRWQPRLWRAVQAALVGPTDEQVLRAAIARVAAGDVPADVPARVTVFGLASLPSPHLELLTALAAHREVHVLAPVASERRWGYVAEQRRALGPLALPVERADPMVPVGDGSTLVAGWGRASREAHLLLLDAALQAPGSRVDPPAPVPDPPERPTLLQRLQYAVRADEGTAVGDDRRPRFDPAVDPTVRWHRAYGPARQVEVLRDALLHLFEEVGPDGTSRFEARDVAVLCPDPSRFAPLVEAVFAGDDNHGVPSIPARVADRSLRQDNPILDTAAALLDLLEGRFRASSVIAFASRPPVRLRFGFDADGLTRISEWAEATNVRWGLGPDDHAAFGLPGDLEVHTWRAGLDQLLVGATMAAAGPRLGPGEVALHPGLEGADVEVAGALAELVDRLDLAVDHLRSARTVHDWCAALAAALADLCAVPDTEAWQWRAVERALEELRDDASVEGVPRTTEVDPADLAVLVRSRLGGTGGRPRFGTGAVTVSSLTAQRGVPHKVICLLGLDDDTAAGSLPASEDLVAATPCVGDRDARSEQRAQLLDAVLAAEERFLVFSTGHDIRTNAVLPPVVSLAELLDVVDGTVRLPEGHRHGRPSRAITVEHPRQAWSEPALRPGELGTEGPWSFDRGALAAAEARRAQRQGTDPFLPEPLGPFVAPADVAGSVPELPIDELVTACSNAPELLLRRRLGISLPTVDEERDDAIPLKLDPLEAWKVTDRLLQVRLACDPDRIEETEEAWERVERRRGAVPPLAFGADALTDARRRVVALHEALRRELGDVAHDPRPVPLDAVLDLPGGARRLSGAVGGVCDHLVVGVTASRIRARDHLRAWVRAAALTAAEPGTPWEVVTIGRDPDADDKAAVKVLRVRMVDPDAALEALAVLADLRDRALRDVVPVFAQTSFDLWARGLAAAKGSWDSNYGGDGDDRWVSLAVGSEFDDVLSLVPRPDEPVAPAPGARLGYWAERVWGTFERTTGMTLRRDAEVVS
jgi:exodeoxyribonuclease V gamma subunit